MFKPHVTWTPTDGASKNLKTKKWSFANKFYEWQSVYFVYQVDAPKPKQNMVFD